jgi:hypothetical protein
MVARWQSSSFLTNYPLQGYHTSKQDRVNHVARAHTHIVYVYYFADCLYGNHCCRRQNLNRNRRRVYLYIYTYIIPIRAQSVCLLPLCCGRCRRGSAFYFYTPPLDPSHGANISINGSTRRTRFSYYYYSFGAQRTMASPKTNNDPKSFTAAVFNARAEQL